MFKLGIKHNIPPDNLEFDIKSNSYTFDLDGIKMTEEQISKLVAEMEYLVTEQGD